MRSLSKAAVLSLACGTLVATVGVIATSRYRRAILHAKCAEAVNSLAEIGKRSAEAYERETPPLLAPNTGDHTIPWFSLCPQWNDRVPSSPEQIRGKKYQSSPQDWTKGEVANAGFACLRFSLDLPRYYMYEYRAKPGREPHGLSSEGASFTATANGDLNGDGVLSTFLLSGQLNSNLILELSPALAKTNPDE